MMEASPKQASFNAVPLSHNSQSHANAEPRKGSRAPFTLIEGDDKRPLWVDGRQSWALGLLLDKGARGVTSRECPGARLSDYVFKLRALGVNIETVEEEHDGEFPGRHGRYLLRSQVIRLAQEAAI